jgi:RNA 3'-terminal phosphate cyclase
MSSVWGFGPDGGDKVLTSMEVAEKTVTYAVGRSIVIRNEVLRHIMEVSGTPLSRSFRHEMRCLQGMRYTITITMNHLPGWRSVGAKASPRWVREQ